MSGDRAGATLTPAAPASPAPDGDAPRPLSVRCLGTVAYGEALALQADLVQQRRAGFVPDQLLLLEHPHVITLGTSARAEHVLLDEDERRLLGIDLFETGRGGDVTYHGPGQLVGYPILDLKPDRQDLHRYVRDIEAALIQAIAHFGVVGARKPGLTGVWIGDAKIAAIGVRVSSGWITSHGFALNVTTDLDFFDAIVPCGIREYGVTSLARTTSLAPAMDDVIAAVRDAFLDVFDRRLEPGAAGPGEGRGAS